MWEPGYLKSLGPLQGALSDLGATTCLEKVSMVPEEVEERSTAYAEHMVDFVSFQLHLMDSVGFFALLAELPVLADWLRDLRAPPLKWPRTRAVADILRSLEPIIELLSRFNPPKVHDTLWRLRALLADWDGSNALEHLCRIQEALEAVQPQSTHRCLVELSALLEAQSRRLAWMVCRRPFTGLPLGPPAVLRKWWRVGRALKAVLALPQTYMLQVLQKVLEVLDGIQAIVPQPSDQED